MKQFFINWKRDKRMKRALPYLKGRWINEGSLY